MFTENELNSILGDVSGALRVGSIFFPGLAPVAAAAATVKAVVDDIEAGAQKIEASIAANGGKVLPAHLFAAQAGLAGDWTATQTLNYMGQTGPTE